MSTLTVNTSVQLNGNTCLYTLADFVLKKARLELPMNAIKSVNLTASQSAMSALEKLIRAPRPCSFRSQILHLVSKGIKHILLVFFWIIIKPSDHSHHCSVLQ